MKSYGSLSLAYIFFLFVLTLVTLFSCVLCAFKYRNDKFPWNIYGSSLPKFWIVAAWKSLELYYCFILIHTPIKSFQGTLCFLLSQHGISLLSTFTKDTSFMSVFLYSSLHMMGHPQLHLQKNKLKPSGQTAAYTFT